MKLNYAREAVATVWLVALVSMALAAQVRSLSGWIVIAAIGLTSTLILRAFWRVPAPSLSESINAARQ